MTKKVFVSGCYDLLHSGHVAFFQEAAQYGDLYVALGSDQTVFELKGRAPLNTDEERLFMVKSVSVVKEAFISQGSGILDFEQEFREIKPDILIVNEDGNIPAKRDLCEELGVEYVILQRTPHANLMPRSTTALRKVETMPYRIDLAGGWLDQPFVSKHHPGPVITVSIEPTIEFNERSGMASSTRRSAIEMWGPRLPVDNYYKLAKMLFCFDNPPGTKIVSGAQDSIGIVYPGLSCHHYEGNYWPTRVDHIMDEQTLSFVEKALYLTPLGPRYQGYNPLDDTKINPENARALADAADNCWKAIQERNLQKFGAAVRASFEAQVTMFPHMSNPSVEKLINQYHDRVLGWKLAGAGGGGYLVLVSAEPLENAIKVIVRQE